MMMLLVRWTLIVSLSIAIMLPPIWAISAWAVERAEAQHRATRKPAPGQKDFGFGLRGLEALVFYTAGSFVVIWPVALWASWRLLRNVGRTRRGTAGSVQEGAPVIPASELVVTREQVIGAPPAPAENRIIAADIPLDDDDAVALGAQTPK